MENGTWFNAFYKLHIVSHNISAATMQIVFVVILLSLLAILSSRKLVLRNPGRFQSLLEFIASSLDGYIRSIAGKEAKTLTPIMGTIFIFILIMNLLGIIPGFTSPTANFTLPVVLAVFSFFMVQYFGIKRKGLAYFKHFVGEPIWLAPLMIPIHIIGELARPLSLTIRLFGNIFGEDTVILVLIAIVIKLLPWYFPIPLQFPMLLFAVFTGFVQALVFSTLVTIYISTAIADHD